jgi:8-oxo-dGTP pyrophosphatase MutT (NUDIX family)
VSVAEERIASETVFEGKLVSVRVDTVRQPSGREATREVVEHPGAVAILPVTDDGRFILVRQFRYAIGRELLEVPAGTREPDESAEACAIRELREEIGMEAETIEELARFFVSPGWCSEELIVYRATGLREVGVDPEQDEDLDIVTVSPDDVFDLMQRGEIGDAKTMTAILRHLAGS